MLVIYDKPSCTRRRSGRASPGTTNEAHSADTGLAAAEIRVAGEHGVREGIQNILAEFDLTMALAGCVTLDDVANAILERVV
jgi:FMN-dependent dehydrogenase